MGISLNIKSLRRPLMTVSVGIDDIAIHIPRLYFDIKDFAEFRCRLREVEPRSGPFRHGDS